MDLSGNNGRLLVRLLQATEERHRILAGNIANQNTPGFHRRDLKFEELLSKEFEGKGLDATGIEPLIVVDEATEGRADGNNVNLEIEHALLRENLLRYELYSAIARGRSNILRSAIHGDR